MFPAPLFIPFFFVFILSSLNFLSFLLSLGPRMFPPLFFSRRFCMLQILLFPPIQLRFSPPLSPHAFLFPFMTREEWISFLLRDQSSGLSDPLPPFFGTLMGANMPLTRRIGGHKFLSLLFLFSPFVLQTFTDFWFFSFPSALVRKQAAPPPLFLPRFNLMESSSPALSSTRSPRHPPFDAPSILLRDLNLVQKPRPATFRSVQTFSFVSTYPYEPRCFLISRIRWTFLTFSSRWTCP